MAVAAAIEAPSAWEAWADTVLQQEAVLTRLGRGLPPSDLSGLFVSDADAACLLAELPGMGGAPAGVLTGERAALAPALAHARGRLTASLAGDGPLAELARRAALSADDVATLALLVAVDVDVRRQRLTGYIQDDLTLGHPTLALLRSLGLAHTVAAGGRLRRAALVEVDGEGAWARRMAVPADRVAAWVLGADAPDGLDGLDFVHGPGGGHAEVVVVSGADRCSRRAAAFAISPGRSFLLASADEADEWAAVVRSATLHADGVVVEVGNCLPDDARRWIDRADHLCWIVSSPHELPLESLPRRRWVEVQADSTAADAAEWRRLLGVDPPPGHLLGRDHLELVAAAFDGVDVRGAVRRLAGGHLDRLARRIRPTRGWSDVVLPEDQSARLRELAARYAHRHTVHRAWGFRPAAPGLVALFAGPSGTGKTLAAEVVAGELGLDLYQVNLASLVSKYIGETEKNLEAVFDAAAHGSLALFFDEADAVFGKRSEVSDAHDRHANVEVAYLLQRLDRHEGLVFLATNLQRNIDTAFLRRVHVSIDFPEPAEEHRLAIWSIAFPPAAPVELDGDDLAFLAGRFKLTGGAISNVALHAAFLAAEAGEPISMRLVLAALRREMQKLGRLWSPDDVGPYATTTG